MTDGGAIESVQEALDDEDSDLDASCVICLPQGLNPCIVSKPGR